MFDAVRFLKGHFQSADGVIGAFRAYGLEAPVRDTVRKWFQRGSIPGEWLPLLVAVAELEDGQAIRLAPYITREA